MNVRISASLVACALFVWVVTVAKAAQAQGIDDPGMEAYLRGDYATAFSVWLTAAEQGDAASQSNIGNMYRSGQGVAKDDSQAALWTERAAAQGSPFAQFNIGVHYAQGHGVPKDDAKAVAWWTKAAEWGHPGGSSQPGQLSLYRAGYAAKLS